MTFNLVSEMVKCSKCNNSHFWSHSQLPENETKWWKKLSISLCPLCDKKMKADVSEIPHSLHKIHIWLNVYNDMIGKYELINEKMTKQKAEELVLERSSWVNDSSRLVVYLGQKWVIGSMNIEHLVDEEYGIRVQLKLIPKGGDDAMFETPEDFDALFN